MKKEIAKEKEETLIKKIADSIDKEIDDEFSLRQIEMWEAEAALVASLDQSQRELYEDFSKKRENVYSFMVKLIKTKKD